MTNTAIRDRTIKGLLIRRREIHDQVQQRLKGGRADRESEVSDGPELFEADVQRELDLALTQMKSETVQLIDEALVRLSTDTYGVCSDCQGPIAKERLRALPFAVRCLVCEGRREYEQGRARTGKRAGDLPFFAERVAV